MDTLFPGVEHRFCMRHMYSNFQKLHKGKELKDLMWGAASAYTIPEFELKMRQLRATSTEAHDWLMKEPPQCWARCYYSRRAKCNRMVNNLCESFNNAIRKVRDQPILTMMEELRRYIMQRYVNRSRFAENFNSNICPNVTKKLEFAKEGAKEYSVLYCSTEKFEISSPLMTWIVDIGMRTCTCRKWDVSGIPCRHACAAMIKDRRKPEDFIDPYFFTSTYKQSYAYFINPIPDKSMWVRTEYDDIEPPPYRKPTGRPRKSRRRADDETSTSASRVRHVSKCRKCNKAGHNARTCKAQIGETSTPAEVDLSLTSPEVPVESSSQQGQSRIMTRRLTREVRATQEVGRGKARGGRPRTQSGLVIGRGKETTGRPSTTGIGVGVGRGKTTAGRGQTAIRGRGISSGRGFASTATRITRQGILNLTPTAEIGTKGVPSGGGRGKARGGGTIGKATTSTTSGASMVVGAAGGGSKGVPSPSKCNQGETHFLRHGKKVTWKSASQPHWKIAKAGDGVFSSKGSTQ